MNIHLPLIVVSFSGVTGLVYTVTVNWFTVGDPICLNCPINVIMPLDEVPDESVHRRVMAIHSITFKSDRLGRVIASNN